MCNGKLLDGLNSRQMDYQKIDYKKVVCIRTRHLAFTAKLLNGQKVLRLKQSSFIRLVDFN